MTLMTMKRLFAFALVLAASVPAVAAQAGASFTGKWDGTFTLVRPDGTTQPNTDEVTFNLTQKGSVLTGDGGPTKQQWPIQKGAVNAGKATFENGPPSRVFFGMLYQNVMEGMFADPIYGGNRNKAGWKLIGFPGVIAVHYANVEKFRDKKYSVDPLGIADMS